MKTGYKVSFYIDAELYVGIIQRIDEDTVDVLTFECLVCNIPINEIRDEKQ